MEIYAIGDLHLDWAAPDKGMEVFGSNWRNHKTKIADNWVSTVRERDIVLIPGDLSWSASLQQAAPDLRWLDQLPGTKVVVRGNHDHWWGSIGKTRSAMPRSVRLIQNDHLRIGTTLFFGAKMEESSQFETNDLIDWDTDDKQPPARYRLPPGHPDHTAREERYQREIERLRLSIRSIPSGAERLRKIALLHYPPTNGSLISTEVTELIEAVPGVSDVVFGHLHSMRSDFETAPFGERRGVHGAVHYHLCSADWLDFRPKKLRSKITV